MTIQEISKAPKTAFGNRLWVKRPMNAQQRYKRDFQRPGQALVPIGSIVYYKGALGGKVRFYYFPEGTNMASATVTEEFIYEVPEPVFLQSVSTNFN